MSRSDRRQLSSLGWAGSFLLPCLVLLASCTPTKQAPPKPEAAAVTAGPKEYVGAETCKGCHEDQYQKFAATKMGRLFLKQPRNTMERLACETCHGPGKAHVDAGGGKGVGGMINFSKKDPTPVEQDRKSTRLNSSHSRASRMPSSA